MYGGKISYSLFYQCVIIYAYTPTADSSDKESEKFYNDLDIPKTQKTSQYIKISKGDHRQKISHLLSMISLADFDILRCFCVFGIYLGNIIILN